MSVRLVSVLALLFLCGAFLMVLIHRVRSPHEGRERTDWVKYGIFAGVVTVVIAVATAGRFATAAMLAWLSVHGGLELSRHLSVRVRERVMAVALSALILALSLGHLLMLNGGDWSSRFAFAFIIVAVADSFSQLWGRLLGRHRLCPRLSPNKTWEGLLGGIATAMLSGPLFGFLLPDIDITRLVTAGLLIALAGIGGDLAFSAVKRSLDIKDFSNILPGHGGVLDRFDSLVGAAPCIYWVDQLLLR